MVLYVIMINNPDFYRTLASHYSDQLNDTMTALSLSEEYLRPVQVPNPLKLRVMSVISSTAVMDKLQNNPNHTILNEMLGALPAGAQIAAVPHAVKFLPIGRRLGKAREVIEQEAREEGFSTNKGVRSVSLELKTIKDNQFLPIEFQRAAQTLGATKFQESPQNITLGWLDLATHSEDMTHRREIILDAILQKVGVVLLEPIELGSL
jgi:hypothetical protein